MSLCVSMCLSPLVYVSMCQYVSVCVGMCLYESLCVYVFLNVSLCLYLSLYMSPYLYMSLTTLFVRSHSKSAAIVSSVPWGQHHHHLISSYSSSFVQFLLKHFLIHGSYHPSRDSDSVISASLSDTLTIIDLKIFQDHFPTFPTLAFLWYHGFKTSCITWHLSFLVNLTETSYSQLISLPELSSACLIFGIENTIASFIKNIVYS